MNDRRAFIPILAAVVLTIVTVWRVSANRPQKYEDQVAAAVVMRAAPGFEARDSDNHLVRLSAFLGRHKIILLFFDGEAGADKDPGLQRLKDRFAELQSQSVKVIGISAATPWKNRTAMEQGGTLPFPLVTDIDPKTTDVLKIHRQWGRIDPATGKPRPGVFLVDRKGQVQFNVEGPKPLPSVDQAIDEALK